MKKARKKYKLKVIGKQTKLRILFDQRGVDRAKFCKATKLHASDASNLINGKVNMTLRTLQTVCKYLDCTPNDIIDYEPWMRRRAGSEKPQI